MTVVTTTVEIRSQHEMATRLGRKNTKDQLARALARVWDASLDSSPERLRKEVDEVLSQVVWGY